MKTLIIYYSYDGNTELVVNELKPLLNADVLRLETIDEKKRTGLSKYAWGGSQIFMKARPKLKTFSTNFADYDLIVLGTPVWAGTPAPAMNSFLHDAKLEGKKLALFVCHLGGKGHAIEKMSALCGGSTILSTTDFIQPSKMSGDQVKAAVSAWADKLKG
ncbi:MAG: flavodoxin [Termitinemataceae bacterium]|nr:MAG: flavodoxin [Termitinemataceae bacterium]